MHMTRNVSTEPKRDSRESAVIQIHSDSVEKQRHAGGRSRKRHSFCPFVLTGGLSTAEKKTRGEPFGNRRERLAVDVMEADV